MRVSFNVKIPNKDDETCFSFRALIPGENGGSDYDGGGGFSFRALIPKLLGRKI